MRPVLCNDIAYMLYLELDVVFREHISHFRISVDEFSIVDQLIKYRNEGQAGHANDLSTERLILTVQLTELTIFRKRDLP